MDAARELFVKHGYEHVTMRQIAESCGYTAGAFYVHFKDKRDLLLAICRHDFEQFQAVLRALQVNEADPIARIWLMGRGYLQFAHAYPRHYEMMFMSKTPPGVEPEPVDLAKIGDPNVDGFAFLVQCVQSAIDAGVLRPELTDARVIAQTLWAGLHGVAALQITFASDPWMNLSVSNHVGEVMQAAMLRGLVRTPANIDHLIATHPLRNARMKLGKAGTRE